MNLQIIRELRFGRFDRFDRFDRFRSIRLVSTPIDRFREVIRIPDTDPEKELRQTIPPLRFVKEPRQSSLLIGVSTACAAPPRTRMESDHDMQEERPGAFNNCEVTADAEPEPETDAEVVASRSTSSEQRAQKRSDIWEFIVEHDDGTYSCLCCSRSAKTQIWNSKAHTTMRRHLQTYHSAEYKGSTSASASQQSDLLSYFERCVKQRTDGEFSKSEADSALVDWIVADSQPFAIVDDKKFVAFCNTLQPDYKVPVRQTVRRHVTIKWKMEKELVRKTLISECIGCRTSMTTDMWTSAAKRGYMVVTLHWMRSDWIMRSVILGFKRVEYPHTGVRLADHLLDVIMEMDGELLKSLWAITTDNAGNNGTMVDAINSSLPNQLRQQMEINIASSASVETSTATNDTEAPVVFQVHCMAHVLQLAVKEGLQKCPFVDSSIGVVRDILKKIAESPSLLEALKSVCEALQISFRIPELDCVTRWNSTWDMVSTAIKLRKPVEELQRRIRERHTGYTEFKIGPDSRLARELSTDTWDALSQFHRFLTPVKAATTMMSGNNYPTFGMAVVVFDMISKHATKVVWSATSQYTIEFAKAFAAKLGAYKEAVKTREAKIAALLDPRAKQLVQSGDADMEAFKRCVCDEYESKYRPIFEAQQHESRTPQRSPQEEQDAELYEALNDLIDDSYGVGAPTTSDDEPFSSELDRWLAHRDKTMHSKTKSREVCKWMRSLVGFPRIQLMARDFLAVMATSVPSEQAFSAAGSTVSVTRARLGDEAVQAVSEMQSFLKFNKATEKLLSDGNDSEGE